MTNPTSLTVEPSDQARKAAEELYHKLHRENPRLGYSDAPLGLADGNWFVQAFARFEADHLTSTDRLRDALEPFARYLDALDAMIAFHGGGAIADKKVLHVAGTAGLDRELKMGDFRRARAAYNEALTSTPAPTAWPQEPDYHDTVRYRGWEIGWNSDAASFGFPAWDAYKGGCDDGAPRIQGKTYHDVLREIDAEEEGDMVSGECAATYWLIERRVSPPQWAFSTDPSGVGAFSPDIHRSHRFPSQEAAEGAMRRMRITPQERGEYFVSEHKDIAAPISGEREAAELLRQAFNALSCTDKNDPLEPIADNGMTVWDGMRNEMERLKPHVHAYFAARAALQGHAHE